MEPGDLDRPASADQDGTVSTERSGVVEAVHRSDAHGFSKATVGRIELVAGLGVEGDVHSGAQVQHRSRVAADPAQPNLRQVHLIGVERFEEVAAVGLHVAPGDLGENITVRGIDLLGLPTGTVLRLGDVALVALTGLRNPCPQIERFRTGLLREMVGRSADGDVVLRAGVMGVVVLGGSVAPDDVITAALPPGPPVPLQRV